MSTREALGCSSAGLKIPLCVVGPNKAVQVDAELTCQLPSLRLADSNQT